MTLFCESILVHMKVLYASKVIMLFFSPFPEGDVVLRMLPWMLLELFVDILFLSVCVIEACCSVPQNFFLIFGFLSFIGQTITVN